MVRLSEIDNDAQPLGDEVVSGELRTVVGGYGLNRSLEGEKRPVCGQCGLFRILPVGQLSRKGIVGHPFRQREVM